LPVRPLALVALVVATLVSAAPFPSAAEDIVVTPIVHGGSATDSAIAGGVPTAHAPSPSADAPASMSPAADAPSAAAAPGTPAEGPATLTTARAAYQTAWTQRQSGDFRSAIATSNHALSDIAEALT